MLMRAAILTEHGGSLLIMSNVLIPDLKRGQVLVKILFAGLCHSQLMEINGKRGEDRYLPHMLGHEGIGRIVKIGEGVTKVKINDEVILGWIKGEGLDGGGSLYQTTDGLTINAGAVTTFSEYAVISENRVVKKPKHTPTELAVLYGCAVPTGLGMVLNAVPNNFSGSVAFIGMGGIGLSALLSTKLRSFEKVIVIDVNQDKLILSKELGATHLVNATEEDVVQTVKGMTNNCGVDFCFESAGSVKTIELAFAITRRFGGQCIFASHPSHGEKLTLDPFELICGKKIEGTWGGGAFPDKDIKKFDHYFKENLLPLERLISKKYDLDNINIAVIDLQNKKISRALIQCYCD